MNDRELRARYLTEVLATLYPPSDGGRVAHFVAVPNARKPRLLVPAGSRRVAAGAVRRYAQPAARSARFKRDLAALALRTGADRALLRDRITVTGADSIEEHLRRVLDRDLTVSVHIGPARANRKPVLQLLAPDGTTVGFAKLGTNALTRRLVRAETVAEFTMLVEVATVGAVTTMLKLTVAPAPIAPKFAVTMLPDRLQDAAEHDRYTTFAGRVSVTVALAAGPEPMFLSVTV